MKNQSEVKEFINELSKTANVKVSCERVGLSRQTIYRWLKEWPGFKKRYDEALIKGRDNINDLAEGKLISLIKQGKFQCIKYWLDNNHRNYIKPRDSSFFDAFKVSEKLEEIRCTIFTTKEEVELLKKKEEELKNFEERLLKRELD
ncbi:MAG: hypothetical protein ACYC3G_03110 [Minisyncoccota bacterium]